MKINDKSPIVTVIITVYNRKKRFKRAIESVLNQYYQKFEVIIIDDGSTDNIESEISKIVNYDSRIKYLKHSNRKTVLSLNTGLKLATGKYITFLDSDDEYQHNHLDYRVNFLNTSSNIDLIYSDATLIGKEEDFLVPDAKDPSKLIHLSKCIIGATIFGYKYVFEELNGFREIYSYDSDFIKRAKRKFNVLKVIKPTYIYHRESPDSILTNMKKDGK